MAHEWDETEVTRWARDHCSLTVEAALEGLDGPALLAMGEADLQDSHFQECSFVHRKKFLVRLKALQLREREAMARLGLLDSAPSPLHSSSSLSPCPCSGSGRDGERGKSRVPGSDGASSRTRSESSDLRARLDCTASSLKPEVWKAFLSLCYVFLVTWITAVVMVIVHDKVPDMKKYPPLPDLFLDNVPHIPWAFDMCEITGSILMAIWIVVLLFHKHRFILLRRFFALSGTVFLLRCITMLITSLSVPGGHLKCAPRSYPSDVELYSNWSRRLNQAYAIWTGAGMSVRGVRTCGDYMFSGHTVALTLLNFFITEYTSRSLYLLHIVTWLMNMFGIFFILAAHEHYSIDVFIAFYITSRLFLYYHTLSNNQALMQGDSLRTRIWFPLLSFFESEVDGIVPNEYESPLRLLVVIRKWIAQIFHDLSETSVVRFAGNSLNQQAAMVDFSVARMLDNLKRNLSVADRFKLENAPNCGSTSSDKNIQTSSVPLDNNLCHLHYCTDTTCQQDKIYHNSTENSTKTIKKDN